VQTVRQVRRYDQVRSELLSFLEGFHSILRFAAGFQVGFFISEYSVFPKQVVIQY
jgi:hypothetical protein